MNNAPIACTLSAADRPTRIAEIAALNGRALREARRDDLILTLSYAAEAAADVREMVRREEECCAFLTFTVREEEAVVRVVIEAPPEAREAAETMFDALAHGTRSGCGCG